MKNLLFLSLLVSSLSFQEITKPEYEIYQFLLNHLILPKTSINLKDSTTNNIGKLIIGSDDREKEKISIEEYNQFLKKNKLSSQIDISKINLNYSEEYKRSAYIEFSRPHIFKDTLCIVYSGVQYAPLNGEGNIYILRYNKEIGKWEVKNKYLIWIS